VQVTVTGWARDMGAKPLLSAELAYLPPMETIDSYDRGETYFHVERRVRELPQRRRKVWYTIRVSAHAELNLNGSYLVQLELDRDEVAKLFYLTNGDRGLPDLFDLFSTFKAREVYGLQREPVAPRETPQRVAAFDISDLPFNPAFLKKVDELELSPRLANCLKNENIVYIGDLVQKSEAEMFRIPNFGGKSLDEIKEVLEMVGLHLGMEIPDWPPENVEELA
jgi:Bacterial RNA polymerase, alpha chain C terminal domain